MKDKVINVLVGIVALCLGVFAIRTLSGTAPEPKPAAIMPVPAAKVAPQPVVPSPTVAPKPPSPPERTPDESLFYAVRNNDLLRMAELVKQGAKVTATDEYGWTPLHVAALKGHRAAAEYLLAHGADVDAADDDGWTPLHVAAMQAHDTMVDLLITSHAEVNAGDNEGWTPLHLAAKKNAVWIVQKLIGAGADVDAEDSEGGTPLTYAANAGAAAAGAILRKSGATLRPTMKSTPNDPSP